MYKNEAQASEKQFAFVSKLLKSKDMSKSNHSIYLTAISTVITNNPETLTKSAASKAIDILLTLPSKDQAKATTTVAAGFYSLDNDIYKVVVSPQTGNTYAKVFTNEGWVYAQGAVKKLQSASPLTLEQAKEYGKLYGTCIVCSRTLTDEQSIANGIGPICEAKF